MSNHPLAGTYLKLWRAHEHLVTLHLALERFRESEKDAVALNRDLPIDKWIESEQLGPAPPRLSLIIGDTIHNARTSLDYLATALVRRSGNEPSTTTQFPICITPSAFKKRASGQTAGMSRGMLRVIELSQPFKRTNQPKEHPLSLLHSLDIIDKHRELHVAVASISSRILGWDEIRPVLEVVFRNDVGSGRGRPVTWVLGDILVETGIVLEKFKESFFRSAHGRLPDFDPLSPPREDPSPLK